MGAKRMLVLTDGKAGHENQTRAFARAMGCEAVAVPVEFRSRWSKALSYGADRLGVRAMGLFEPVEIPEGEFAAVAGAGSGTFYAVKCVAAKLGIPSAAVLYPRGYDVHTFDCVMAPFFDKPRKARNVVEVPANLVAADAEFYAAGVESFRKRHPDGGRPAAAVVIGGPNAHSRMDAEWVKGELEKIFEEHAGEEKWVTTSRRTPPEVEAVVDSFPFDYKLLYSREKYNPIPAFVSLARTLYATAESTAMLSEACTFGSAEVRVLDNLNPGPSKFRHFAEVCAGMGSRKFDLGAPFARARALLGL